MEGLYFDVKPRKHAAPKPRSSENPGAHLTSNHRSCPSLSGLSSPAQALARERTASWVRQVEEEVEEEIRYKLTMIGYLPVHHLTTMTMLPWVVAEIGRKQTAARPGARSGGLSRGSLDAVTHCHTVFLHVSASWVRCMSVLGDGVVWDPLTHTVLFECRPHQVTKLMHNSQEPSSFACLVRETSSCACYVFQCQDSSKVWWLISARSNDINAATIFAKKFEVLFCGRVSVAHKKAPPALIDECIEKFSQLHGSGTADKEGSGEGLVGGLKRALAFQSNGLRNGSVGNGAAGSPTTGARPVLFKRDPSFPCLQALDENGLSPEISNSNTDDPVARSAQVQPTSLRENRTMLFTVGRSQIYLVSPDTKKVAIEKSFREISFCSQGIRHVDHFGFICRETVEGGNCHFVCYVFQCTDESLVDEIMLTLKQAFSVAALQQNAKTQSEQCDSCPMQHLHRLCERIEGRKLFLNSHAHEKNDQTICIYRFTMARPKSDQEENELVMASLRNLYEEQQKRHQHTVPGNNNLLITSSNYSSSISYIFFSLLIYGTECSLLCLNSTLTVCLSELGDACLDGGLMTVGQVVGGGGVDSSMRAVPEERKKRSKEELRELWRKAIIQQILLQRMERENQKLQDSASNLQNKRLKLDYEEITPCLKEVTLVWEKMLGTHGRAKVKFDSETIHAAVAQGVPRQHRGEIWKFLSEQYLLRQTVPSRPPSNHAPYKELLKQLTSQQHAILIDLGRTFPTHPYFQAQLGAGQLSLFNILKAYSLLDPEVGYCQGLSFIAGVLLLHMGEEDAFNMLKFLMYDVGLRKQYRPDMIILQIQMYQLSRLLHDYHRDLYSHLERQEIGPSLYATPWFLTAFASHFPLGFVARVFDMLFLQGSEVIFKVALSLLGSHKPLILQHESLESIVDFIKTTLPNLGLVQMEKTINQVCEMDVSKQLQAYEVEYHVLQDELLETPPTLNQHQRAAQLERTNQSLRQQNLDLLEELQVSHARVCSLEGQVEALTQSEGRLKEQVSSLEEEKRLLASTILHLQGLLTRLGIHSAPDGDTAAPQLEAKEALDDRTVDSPPQPLLLPKSL
uniref:TBC1 domain family member 4 n=1 Tax=Salarias fasciatus TaxID=181472 RepID=A0A672JF25_SALFA